MIAALEGLRIVALDGLILHEAHDEARLEHVRDGVREEAVQRNPVIVAPLPTGGYLVLDGAHRVRALSELGCKLVLVQMIEPPERAESWGHLIPSSGLDAALRAVNGVEVSEEKPEAACPAEVRFFGGRRLYARARNGGLVEEVRALRALQELYQEGVVVRRVTPEAEPNDGEAVIVYRRFTPAEMAEAVEQGEVLPAGITRFVVAERILNVRYPLHRLAGGDLDVRNAELREFVEGCWNKGRIRHYSEPVVLFE